MPPLAISFKAVFSFKVAFAVDVCQLVFLAIMVFDFIYFVQNVATRMSLFSSSKKVVDEVSDKAKSSLDSSQRLAWQNDSGRNEPN